jgi:hypothetical protein
MFRASTDGGATFGDKINLSNSPDTESQTAEILAVGNNNVYVTWWELNENVHPHTNESVMRVSTNAGQTFGPIINLGTNGTIATTTNGVGNITTTTSTTATSSSGANATDDFSFLHVAEAKAASQLAPSTDEKRGLRRIRERECMRQWLTDLA